MADFVIETALLTHGLPSLSNEQLQSAWPWREAKLVWLEGGALRCGTLEEYFPIRDRRDRVQRVDRARYHKAKADGLDAALTASATMAAAMELGLGLAVTAGMGGIGDIRGEELCEDLPALAELPVALIATAPKDVIDIAATIRWLQDHGVAVVGREVDRCTGFVFACADVPLDGVWREGEPVASPTLLLQGIPPEKRLGDCSIIAQARQAGKAAEARGAAYHPAANAEIDRLSGGVSSMLQLNALIANGQWAELLEYSGGKG